MNAKFELAGGSSGGTQRSWWAQAFQNRLIALVLAMIVAVPLLAAPADTSTTGIATLTLEAFAVVLLGVLLWRVRPDLRSESLRTVARTGANVPILLFLGWMTLSWLLSPAKAFSVQSLLQAGTGALLYFAVAYQFRQSKHLSLLSDVLLFLSIAVSLGSLAQFQFATQERAQALFGDSQALASFTVLLLPVVASLAFVDTKPRRQTIAQIAFVLMVGSLLLSQQRGAWIATVVSLGLFFALSLRLSRTERQSTGSSSASLKTRKHLLVMPALMSVIALGFVGVMHTQNASVANRAATLSSLSTDESFQGRVQKHWKGSVEMISQRPLMGWGAGLYPVYQKPFTGMGVAISPTGNGKRVSLAEQAHNYYLQTAVELGLPGLILSIGVLGCFWASACSRLSKMDAGIRRTLLMASLAGTAGFAIDALSSPAWQYAQNSMFLWLLLGVGTSCLRPRARREEEVEPAVVHTLSRRVAFSLRPAAVCACLGLATLLPTASVSAQNTGYNTGDGGTDTFEIAFGAGAIGALGYAVYALITGGGAAVGGAAAGGAAGGGTAGTGGTTGGSGQIIGADTDPTPTPTPAPGVAAPAQP